MAGFVLALAFLAVGAGWVYSHLAPEQFGVCHEVALHVGNRPTARECQAYASTDFAVPLVLIALGVLLVSRDDIKFSSFFGSFERTREKEAAKTLLETDLKDLERRAAAARAIRGERDKAT
jgi:hypothetical protein